MPDAPPVTMTDLFVKFITTAPLLPFCFCTRYFCNSKSEDG
jgi:hypothetical protein